MVNKLGNISGYSILFSSIHIYINNTHLRWSPFQDQAYIYSDIQPDKLIDKNNFYRDYSQYESHTSLDWSFSHKKHP